MPLRSEAGSSLTVVRASFAAPARPADEGATLGAWPIWLSAAAGFIIGLCFFPCGQHTFEAAQALSGIVRLPSTSPSLIHDATVYSLLLIQIPAVLFRLGVSEWTLSLLYSGLQGALSFAAVAAVTLAFSRRGGLAALAPLICLRMPGSIFHGHKYPISFPANQSNGGMFGLFWLVLALGALGMGRIEAGALLFGLLACAPLAAALWMETPERRAGFIERGRRGFILGLTVSILGYVAQHAFIRARLQIDIFPGPAESLARLFIRYWDDHLLPAMPRFTLAEVLGFFHVCLPALALSVSMLACGFETGGSQRFVLRYLVASILLAGAFTLFDERFTEASPLIVKALMITRFLNVVGVMMPLMVMAAAARLADGMEELAFLLMAGAGVGILACAKPIRSALRLWGFAAIAASMIGCMLAGRLGARDFVGAPAPRAGFGPRWRRVARAAAALAIAAIAWAGLPRGGMTDALAFRRYHEVLQRKFESSGSGRELGTMILFPQEGMGLMQLITRRPMLLDAVRYMDAIRYAPKMAPGVESILREVYGTSLSDSRAWDTFGAVRRIWEARSLAEWRRIADRFGSRSVLAPREWRIALPAVMTVRNMPLQPDMFPSPAEDVPETPDVRSVTLYAIPRGAP